MQVIFSVVSEGLVRTYGDAECVVNGERNRRYNFREYHLLTNRIVEEIILSGLFLAAAPLVVL